MQITETERLVLTEFTSDDAAFVLDLVNEPAFHKYIGDRGVRTRADAERYIEERLIARYRDQGFGFWRMALKGAGTAIGMCGLVKRDILDDVDVGFALLEPYEGQGYAFEAAAATLTVARERFGLTRIAGVVDPANARSTRLLERLGLSFSHDVIWPDDGTRVAIYTREL